MNATTNKVVSPEDLERYQREGILFPIRVLSKDACSKFRSGFEELEAHLGGRAQTFRMPHLFLRWAYDLATHPSVLDNVEAVLGPDIMVHSTIIFYKPANDPGHVPWHQDGYYSNLDLPRAVSAWVALTESNRENGCMRVVPGSHRRILPHSRSFRKHNMLKGGSVTIDIDESEVLDVVLKAGEMSLHHLNLMHASNPNRSDGKRVGLVIRYATPAVERSAVPLVRARGRSDCAHVQSLGEPPSGSPEEAVAAQAAFRRMPLEARRPDFELPALESQSAN